MWVPLVAWPRPPPTHTPRHCIQIRVPAVAIKPEFACCIKSDPSDKGVQGELNIEILSGVRWVIFSAITFFLPAGLAAAALRNGV